MSVASLYRGEWADKWVLLNEHKGCGELNVMLQPEDFGKLRSEDEDPPQPDAQEEEAPAAGPIAVAAPAAVAEPVCNLALPCVVMQHCASTLHPV